MNNLPLSAPGLSADPASLNGLKYQAGQEGAQGQAALKETARQFEALFMRELIKSMREATQKSGLLDGNGSDLGTDLLDQQLAVQLSGQPGGLSQAIMRQLGRQLGQDPAAGDSAGGAAVNRPLTESAAPAGAFRPLTRQGLNAVLQYAPGAAASLPRAGTADAAAAAGAARPASVRQASFVAQHSLAAAEVARESGIPAGYMLGQAGHETGWGRSEIRHRDGSPSFNLFGIKATSAWKGKVAEVTTTEYVDGAPRKTVARFRAYDSYADAFRDYALLITRSPRYDQVMDQVGSVQGFASSLQKAGYATDPQYAAKLGRAINTALLLQRAQT